MMQLIMIYEEESGGFRGYRPSSSMLKHIKDTDCSITNTDNQGKEFCGSRSSLWTIMSTSIADNLFL